MKFNVKSLVIFLALFYAALWVGTLVTTNVQADAMTTTVLAVVVPGTLLWFLWTRYGKKAN